MPGSVITAAPSGVFPLSLSLAFVESREYLELQNVYHDGASQRSQLAATSRHVFRLSKKLTAAKVDALFGFYDTQQAGVIPFFFYNPFEPGTGNAIGSNWDATAINTQGRYTVRFDGNWAQAMVMMRSQVSDLVLVELA